MVASVSCRGVLQKNQRTALGHKCCWKKHRNDLFQRNTTGFREYCTTLSALLIEGYDETLTIMSQNGVDNWEEQEPLTLIYTRVDPNNQLLS